MSTSEIHELAVRLTPQGADETEAALEDVEGKVEDTADATDDAEGEVSDFNRRFAGATAILGGAAAVVGGFLSQVPAVSGTLTGLGSVVTSLAFKFDEQFGGAIRNVTDDLFELSNEISRAEDFGEALEITGEFAVESAASVERKLDRLEQSVPPVVIDLAVQGGRGLFQQAQSQIQETIDQLAAGQAPTTDFAEGFVEGALPVGAQELFNAAQGTLGGGASPAVSPTRIPGSGPGGGGGSGGGGGGGPIGQVSSAIDALVRAIQGSTRNNPTVEVDGQEVNSASRTAGGPGPAGRSLLRGG